MYIQENRHQHQSTFEVCERNANGRKEVLRTLHVYFARVINADGQPRYILYDEDMCPIHSIYRYLNVHKKGCQDTTIAHIVTALRLLVAFCTAYQLEDFYVPEIYCSDLVDFLYRDDKTMASTAAVYFSDIKNYLQYLQHDNDPLMEHTYRMDWRKGADGTNRPLSYADYRYAPRRNPERDLVCPPHNTIKEYNAIQNTMMAKIFKNGEKGDIAGCLIVLLLFKYGRRIGEVLGLTIEDISTHVNSETGEVSYCLYFRNRVNEKVGHRAKNRKTPTNKAYYTSKDYIQNYRSSRNCIKLEENIYCLLKAYIETEHAKARKNNPEKYATALADIVNPEQFALDWGLEDNHYLFINMYGGPLRKAAWYKRLLKYYQEANVPLGFGKSPNHAFRHGIAYILRHFLHMSTREIADFLGHKNEETADIYAKADYDMIGRLTNAVQKYIDQEIQNLNEINNENDRNIQ